MGTKEEVMYRRTEQGRLEKEGRRGEAKRSKKLGKNKKKGEKFKKKIRVNLIFWSINKDESKDDFFFLDGLRRGYRIGLRRRGRGLHAQRTAARARSEPFGGVREGVVEVAVEVGNTHESATNNVANEHGQEVLPQPKTVRNVGVAESGKMRVEFVGDDVFVADGGESKDGQIHGDDFASNVFGCRRHEDGQVD